MGKKKKLFQKILRPLSQKKKLKETLLKHSPSYEKNKISIIESTKKEYSSQLGAAAIAHKKFILQNNKSMEIINEN